MDGGAAVDGPAAATVGRWADVGPLLRRAEKSPCRVVPGAQWEQPVPGVTGGVSASLLGPRTQQDAAGGPSPCGSAAAPGGEPGLSLFTQLKRKPPQAAVGRSVEHLLAEWGLGAAAGSPR